MAMPTKDGWRRNAHGTDLAAYGTPIYAQREGCQPTPAGAGILGGLVKNSTMNSGSRHVAHKSKLRVKVGQRYARGQRIG